LRESIEDGAFAVVEAWCVRQDGSDFPAEIAVHGINLTKAGQLCFMIRDISRRIQMERDVTRLTKAVASTRDAVVIFDAEGRHVYHNAAGEELLGLSDPEALQLANLLPDEALRNAVSEAMRDGKGWRGEIDVPRHDGKTVPVLFRADAIEIGDESAGAVAIMTDITQRRQDERKLRDTLRELERSNADLAQLAYVASHDLKEPLRGISGYLQLLDRRWGGQLTDMAQQYLHNALQGATRMKEMINHILEYSRLNPPSGPTEPADSTGILSQALANLGQLIRDRKGEVSVENLPPVRVPPARLLQVFQNLIGNALKFCKEKPEVKVFAKTTKDGVVFYVQDNGIGIDPAMVDRVFMLFQRLHTEREYEGTGIGLSTCRKLVEQWGGKIWVESSSPETGTTFAFSVPSDESATPPAE
jgi:PAS domain S-box-containing protein